LTENTIQTVKIKRIINECDGIKTIIFNVKDSDLMQNNKLPKSGQFVMIWVPGIDEIPMSISGYDEKGNWNITVKNIGECTNALCELKVGDYIGVRGPLGNYFKIPQKKVNNIFLIGGGIGMAPLRFFASDLYKENIKFTVIEGVKNKSELIFVDEFHMFMDKDSNVSFCTDDGSYGLEGFASDIFKNIIKDYSQEELSNTIVYTCGPEIMMYNIFQICEKYNIELQASLERIMRCGCGLCGLCVLDPLGLLVCKDGPIFSSNELRNIKDFGKNKRDFSGKKIPLNY